LRFLTDEEYDRYWDELGGTREAIALDLRRDEDALVLDVACGWGYYTFQLALTHPSGMIVAVDIVPSAFTNIQRKKRDLGTTNNIGPLMADAASLPVRDGVFDLATNFLGMRDIYMTREKAGVEKSVKEMIRATRKMGRIALAVTPPDLAETEDLRVAVEVEGEVFGARSLPSRFYTNLFRENGIRLLGMNSYFTGSKMTADQTRTELIDGIRIAREIYGREVPNFEEVWERYGPAIERSGYGMYSKITLFLGEKA